MLTKLLEHFVAFVQDEVFCVFEVEGLVARQCKDPARSTHNDVRAVFLENFFVLLDGHATEEHGHLHVVHVLAETLVLFTDLEGQLSGVAQDQYRDLKLK